MPIMEAIPCSLEDTMPLVNEPWSVEETMACAYKDPLLVDISTAYRGQDHAAAGAKEPISSGCCGTVHGEVGFEGRGHTIHEDLECGAVQSN
jgi:hypothetical protein